MYFQVPFINVFEQGGADYFRHFGRMMQSIVEVKFSTKSMLNTSSRWYLADFKAEARSQKGMVVRRQGFRDNGLDKLREVLAHRVGDVMRPAAGAASGG